jgi:hypothetical protein
MRLPRGQPEHVSRDHTVTRASDRNLALPFDRHDERVERSGVFAQSLAGIERERRDRSRVPLQEGATDHGAGLQLNERGQGDDALELGGGVAVRSQGRILSTLGCPIRTLDAVLAKKSTMARALSSPPHWRTDCQDERSPKIRRMSDA